MEVLGVKLEGIHSYEELESLGVKQGDIIAHVGSITKKGPTWHYDLLRKFPRPEEGFPKELCVSLCCYKNPEYLNVGMSLYENGHIWCGPFPRHFRIVGKEERKEFIEACIKTLKEPIRRRKDRSAFGWNEDDYCQTLYNMIRDGLISKAEGSDLNKELIKIHRIDLLKHYRKKYG